MSENLSVYTFGGLQILKAGEHLVGVDSRKVEALFIYLALAERPQPREILANLLWDDRSQQQAQANLRRVLSGLRKHFGPYVEITRATAALNWGADLWLDVRELQKAIEPLKAGSGNLSLEIISQADDALKLYHGDILAGFHVRSARNFDAWLSEQREHWQQVVLETIGTLAGFYESTQSFKEGIELTRRALRVDPLQESFHRGLMRLLVLSGQRTDALQQYEQCRQLLEDELGVPPEPETEALYEAIASGALSVAKPGLAVTIGAQIEGNKRSSELDERSVPTNLPTQTNQFVGREAELAALRATLSDPDIRLVTIVGPGGMGKTRLALAAAEQQLFKEDQSPKSELETRAYTSFGDGVFFVPLALVSTPDKIVLKLAEQLEILFFGDSDPVDQLLDFLGMQHLLLIFDNFEHLIEGARLIGSILQHAPNITILVTSRERLMITGESVFRLGSLSYPDDESQGPTDLEQAVNEYGAISLFFHHARLVRPDLEYDQDMLTEIARICNLVQGMPLAIILAVSWIETLSLEELAEAIANSVDILASQQRDLPPRQRSIRAAFEASWLRLTSTDQAVFSKLSVFQGRFTLKAAENVAGASIFILRTLIEKSLVVPVSSDRYELHELLRQFAEEKLADNGEMERVEQAHGQYYLSELGSLEADVKGQRQVEAFKEIDADLNNITQAWFWALDQAQLSMIDCTLETLTVFCHYYSRGNEGHGLFNAAREKLIAEKNDRLLGRLLARHAWIKSEYGIKTGSIEADLDQSWTIFKQLDDQREIALVLLVRGFFQIRVYDDIDAGVQEFERAFRIYQELDERFYMTILLGRIGYCQVDPTTWSDFIQQSLALALETGNDYEAILCQGNLGAMSANVGDIISAEQIFHEALATASRIGDSHNKYFISNYLGFTGFLRGDLDQMIRYLPSQEDIVIGKVTTTLIASTLATRALLAVVSGDLEASEQLARQSLELQSNLRTELLADWALAMVALDQDNLTEASHWLSATYRMPNITLYPGIMTRLLPVAALFLARLGRTAWAAQILSLATNHPASQIGWLRNWSIGANLRSELEQRLGKVEFQEQWDQGMSLNLAETINLLAMELSGKPQ